MIRMVIVLVGSLSVAGARADEPLAGRLRKLDLKTLDTTKVWSQDLRFRRDAVNLADQSAWHAINTRDDWDKFKTPRIDALRASLGTWPTPVKNPVVAITKKISGDGFQISKRITR